MRTIKSQDGKMIANAEKVLGNCVCENGGKWIITAFDTWAGNDTVGLLGTYSTEKRALRVLDMLNEWQIMHEILVDKVIYDFFDRHDLEAMVKKIKQYNHFRMPQDSGELDA